MALQVGFFTLVGLPFCLYLAAGKQRMTIIGVYTAAPVFGLFLSLWVGVWSFKFGLNQGAAGFILLIVALLTIFLLPIFWPNRFHFFSKKRPLTQASGLIFIITLLTLYFHISDFSTVGLVNYFPRTNDDTFSGLGMIDQLRISKTILPQMKYPAGFSPGYLHAINTRSAAMALVAGQAELFHLDTHVAFFCTLRLTLPLASVGIFSLLLILGCEWFLAAIGTALFVGGNFMLHQILQQFLSSSIGVVCAIGILNLAAITVQARYPAILILIIGAATGIFAMASPEAHFFILASLGLYFLMSTIIIPAEPSTSLLRIVFFFAGGYLLGTFPLYPHLHRDMLKMLGGVAGGHPGDWCAQAGYIIQASGISIFTGPSFAPYGVCERLAAICLAIATMLGLLFLFLSPWLTHPRREKSKNMSLLLGFAALLPFAAGGYFFMAGKGYRMLKAFDYFIFMPAVILGLCLSQARCLLSSTHPIWRFMVKGLPLIALSGYLVITLPNKQEIFREYISNIKAGPELAKYSYESKTGIKGILVDLQGFPLHLFLYVNRWRPIPLYFESDARYTIFLDKNMNASYVFQEKINSDAQYKIFLDKNMNVSHVFRMGYPNIADSGFTDINRPRFFGQPAMAELVDAKGYLRLIPGEGWLPAEGARPEVLFRWLSGAGRFQIFGLERDRGAKLHAYISPGPDLLPENRIEIVLENQVLVVLGPWQLPKEISIEIPSMDVASAASGIIRVTGPSGGIRQISVAALYIAQ